MSVVIFKIKLNSFSSKSCSKLWWFTLAILLLTDNSFVVYVQSPGLAAWLMKHQYAVQICNSLGVYILMESWYGPMLRGPLNAWGLIGRQYCSHQHWYTSRVYALMGCMIWQPRDKVSKYRHYQSVCSPITLASEREREKVVEATKKAKNTKSQAAEK